MFKQYILPMLFLAGVVLGMGGTFYTLKSQKAQIDALEAQVRMQQMQTEAERTARALQKQKYEEADNVCQRRQQIYDSLSKDWLDTVLPDGTAGLFQDGDQVPGVSGGASCGSAAGHDGDAMDAKD